MRVLIVLSTLTALVLIGTPARGDEIDQKIAALKRAQVSAELDRLVAKNTVPCEVAANRPTEEVCQAPTPAPTPAPAPMPPPVSPVLIAGPATVTVAVGEQKLVEFAATHAHEQSAVIGDPPFSLGLVSSDGGRLKYAITGKAVGSGQFIISARKMVIVNVHVTAAPTPPTPVNAQPVPTIPPPDSMTPVEPVHPTPTPAPAPAPAPKPPPEPAPKKVSIPPPDAPATRATVTEGAYPKARREGSSPGTPPTLARTVVTPVPPARAPGSFVATYPTARTYISAPYAVSNGTTGGSCATGVG